MTAPSVVKRPAKRRSPPKPTAGRRSTLLVVAFVLGLCGLLLIYLLGRDPGATSASPGLPRTPDYHSLLVAPDDPETLQLGTHEGLFRSVDGGMSWKHASLAGSDAMNLAQPSASTMWAAGHNVLSRSADGGATWKDVRPSGLPGLDVHGFAVDPRDPTRLLAAIAGQGLFRSTDGGKSFALVSREVGPGVMSLAILPNGRMLAGDMSTNALVLSGDGGKTWKPLIEASVMGLAVNPADPRQVLASGPGVLLSSDGGARWRQTLQVPAGSGPIAWSRSNPRTAYVVGLDRSLHRSTDGGATWSQVVAEEGS